jgi:hypothetical protein
VYTRECEKGNNKQLSCCGGGDVVVGRQLQGVVAKIYRNTIVVGRTGAPGRKAANKTGSLQETEILQLRRATDGRLMVVVGEEGGKGVQAGGGVVL